tara:strand:+ start:480 stop:1034 length:555 start_codon:yes stop_codon:yes gene_type:complete
MKSRVYLFAILIIISCSDNYAPKPRGLFKLDLPKKEYQLIKSDCPFSFEAPIYSVLVKKTNECLFDLEFPYQAAKLHITYLDINDNLYENTEQSRDLAYKHNIVADAISEQLYINDSLKVYGLLYDYKGVTATSVQFFLTDSINHFFRGALYFNTEVCDSILPLNNFLKEDIKHLIETFHWKHK